jgi:hypothetical protein
MFSDLDEGQAKQYIDAEQARKAYLAIEARAITYRGSMYWKKAKGHEYLYRDFGKIGQAQRSQGRRSPETELVYAEFRKAKTSAEQSLSAIRKQIDMHQRINAALRVGRTPNMVIDLLESLRIAGLQDSFMVIGTNSLYAYETHAGVRYAGDITATMYVDLLWDSRKKLTLSFDADFNESGLIGLLRKIDASFHLLDNEKYRAANDRGYMVDLIKRRPASLHDDHEPQQLRNNEGDFWAAKIHNMDWLLSAPKFRQTVVGVNGRMAEMVTVDPRAFVLFKTWMSRKEDRDPVKKPRDRLQAQATYQLIEQRLPHLSFDLIHVSPETVKKLFLDEHPGEATR